MHDPSTSHSDSNIDISVGSAKNRTEQGDESGEFGEEDVAHQYVLGVPIALPLPSFEGPHTAEQMALGLPLQLSTNFCTIEGMQCPPEEVGTMPRRTADPRGMAPPQHANVVRQVRLRAPRLQEPVSPAQPADADQSGTTPSGTGARTDRMQCRRESDVPHCLAQRSRTAGQSQTPAAHLSSMLNLNRSTTKLVRWSQRQQNTQQREWVGRFNAVASALQLLDELLDEFTNAVRQQAQVSFTQRPAQRQRRPRTPPNQMADVATK
ncbi:hypothetical protein niasHS_013982 [Heterodera schachtii]|uniref:Uncharacterized protein n=1 Tax=Heterodera schachtii TaxID=97005 RepID=A0ABD2IPD8_HETSC